MKELGYFAGLGLAFYIVSSFAGFLGAAALIAILVLLERSMADASSSAQNLSS